jgi:uncharacterized protein (TIGR00162 family)
MDDYIFRLSRRPTSGGIMVVGLPDSGLVAKIAVDHLIDSTAANKIADIYSPHFPPQVVVEDDGTSELIAHHLFFDKKHKLLIYTGDTQAVDSEGAHMLSRAVVELAKKFKVKEIIVLAAMITGSVGHPPNVYVSATSTRLVEAYLPLGAKKASAGTITWMHGLILGEAAKAGVDATCFSGETPGELPDPSSAEAILRVVEKKLGFQVDTSKLANKAKEIKEIVEPKPSAVEVNPRKQPAYIG